MTNRTHKCPVCNGDGRVPVLSERDGGFGPDALSYSFVVAGETYRVSFNGNGSKFKVDGPDPLVKITIAATITGGQ